MRNNVGPGPVVIGGDVVEVEAHLPQHYHVPPAVHLEHQLMGTVLELRYGTLTISSQL